MVDWVSVLHDNNKRPLVELYSCFCLGVQTLLSDKMEVISTLESRSEGRMDERLLLLWHVSEQDGYPLLTGFPSRRILIRKSGRRC